jgi:crotonobetainyl-CoA:carnitine CoA-transferase CaiB-like acyl-CoA transferase
VGKSAKDWVAALTAAGVGAVEPVVDDVVVRFHRDPENHRTGRVAELVHPQIGPMRIISRLIRVSDAPPVAPALAPALGEHTDAVLRDLGYDDAMIADLHERKAVR